MPRLTFAHDLGAGASLRLRDLGTVAEMHTLTLANLDRLRRWESWAQADPTEESTETYTRWSLGNWLAGTDVPLVLAVDGRLVGSLGARIDRPRGVAELGYWVDRRAEGQGLVARGVQALVDHLVDDLACRRLEIRTATHNARSRALAERLGFVHEGTLAAAHPVGSQRHDLAVYGSVPAEVGPS